MDPADVFVKSSQEESEGQKQVKELQDLKGKTDAQLRELLERQVHILNQKGLVAKLADKGERVKALKIRIEQELAHREQFNSLGGHLTNVNLGDNMEWNIAAGDEKPALEETASDPLLNYLRLRKQTEEPYVTQMCSKIASPKQSDEGPDRFLPHRSVEASIKGGKSPGGRSPRSDSGIENHTVQEIPIKESMFLQRKQAMETVPKAASQLTNWRQMAEAMDSEESEDELQEERDELEEQKNAEFEEDAPGVPDFEDSRIDS